MGAKKRIKINPLWICCDFIRNRAREGGFHSPRISPGCIPTGRRVELKMLITNLANTHFSCSSKTKKSFAPLKFPRVTNFIKISTRFASIWAFNYEIRSIFLQHISYIVIMNVNVFCTRVKCKFFGKCNPFWLSQFIFTIFCFIFKYPRSLLNQMAFLQACATAIYCTSFIDNATTNWSFDS